MKLFLHVLQTDECGIYFLRAAPLASEHQYSTELGESTAADKVTYKLWPLITLKITRTHSARRVK